VEQDEAWLAEGKERFNAGDLAGAEVALRRVGVSSPLCRDALLQLSRVLSGAGQTDEALRCAEEADNLERDAHSCLQWGTCLFGNDNERAKQLFEQALDLAPAWVDAHIMLGHALRALGQPQAAVRSYEEALRLEDGHAAARFYMAEVLLEIRDVARASTQLHYLLKLQPAYGPAIVLVGDIAFYNQDFRQAIVEYVRAYGLGESSAAMLHRLGQAYEAIRDPMQACKAYDRGIGVDRTHWDTHLAAGRLCEGQNWFNRAHRYYEALAFVQSHRAEAYKGLARVEAGVQASGLEGIDPAGAPDDQFDYLEGPFVVPAVLEATQAIEARAIAQVRATGPLSPTAGREGADAYGVGKEAAGYLADFVAPPAAAVPPAQLPKPPIARAKGSGMLEALQQKLRDKISGGDTGPLAP
jgi:tetratricopeptide (TPR) repeat protein